GEVRVDLDRDVTVLTRASVPHLAENVARLGDVRLGEAPEDVLRVICLIETCPDLLVVEVALGERLLEDGRVRSDADDGVLLHQPFELAALEILPGEIVGPDALAER